MCIVAQILRHTFVTALLTMAVSVSPLYAEKLDNGLEFIFQDSDAFSVTVNFNSGPYFEKDSEASFTTLSGLMFKNASSSKSEVRMMETPTRLRLRIQGNTSESNTTRAKSFINDTVWMLNQQYSYSDLDRAAKESQSLYTQKIAVMDEPIYQFQLRNSFLSNRPPKGLLLSSYAKFHKTFIVPSRTQIVISGKVNKPAIRKLLIEKANSIKEKRTFRSYRSASKSSFELVRASIPDNEFYVCVAPSATEKVNEINVFLDAIQALHGTEYWIHRLPLSHCALIDRHEHDARVRIEIHRSLSALSAQIKASFPKMSARLLFIQFSPDTEQSLVDYTLSTPLYVQAPALDTDLEKSIISLSFRMSQKFNEPNRIPENIRAKYTELHNYFETKITTWQKSSLRSLADLREFALDSIIWDDGYIYRINIPAKTRDALKIKDELLKLLQSDQLDSENVYKLSDIDALQDFFITSEQSARIFQ